MRPIKFRAWDKVDKEMCHWDSLKESPMYLLFEMDSRIYMQYTGLKDKNGKEIFEGDVISILKPRNQKVKACPVVWFESHARWSIQNEDNHFGLYAFETEIIGNIYENPELLKKL